MIKEKIDTIFNQYPQTRIVFFWDEDKTYYDEFQDIREREAGRNIPQSLETKREKGPRSSERF